MSPQSFLSHFIFVTIGIKFPVYSKSPELRLPSIWTQNVPKLGMALKQK